MGSDFGRAFVFPAPIPQALATDHVQSAGSPTLRGSVHARMELERQPAAAECRAAGGEAVYRPSGDALISRSSLGWMEARALPLPPEASK
jgi:hypothetical protein